MKKNIKRWITMMLAIVLLISTDSFSVLAESQSVDAKDYETAPVPAVCGEECSGNGGIMTLSTGDYRYWAQSDSRWGSMKMGSSGQTVAEVGCLVTSITKLIIQCGLRSEDSFNVATLMTWLNSNSGFVDGSLLVWAKPAEYISGFSYHGVLLGDGTYSSSNYNSQLLSWVQQGYHIVLQVSNRRHWVAIDEAKSLATGQIYIMDSKSSMTNADITLTSRYSTFNKVVAYTGGTTASSNKLPVGMFEMLESAGPGKIHLTGWAYDPDEPSKELEIHVYVGGSAQSGVGGYNITANTERTDVGNAYSGVGNYHGFDSTLQVVGLTGVQDVYVYAIDTSGCGNILLGQMTIDIEEERLPVGMFDTLEPAGPGKIRLTGWAYDPNEPLKELEIHVYVGGSAQSGNGGYNITANTERTDVGNAYSGVGNYHGFDSTLQVVGLTGTQEVYVYAIDTSGNANTFLGSMTVDIEEEQLPRGNFEAVVSEELGTVRVLGWAYDPNTPTQAISVHVYVGGPAGSGVACHSITADVPRTDIGSAYPEAGCYHGFDSTIEVDVEGSQEVYVYAINTTPGGEHLLLDSRTVTILSKVPQTRADLPSAFYARVKNKVTGKYLTKTQESEVLSGKEAFLTSFSDETKGEEQLWHFTKYNTSYQIASVAEDGYALDLNGGIDAEGRLVNAYPVNYADSQRWQIFFENEAYYIRNNESSTRFLDTTDNNGTCINTIDFDDQGLEIIIEEYLQVNAPIETGIYGGHEYRLLDKSMTWEDAKAECEKLGGHLVTITSSEEQAFVEALIEQGDKSQYWIGGYYESGAYQWVTGEVFDYTNWDAGEPNGAEAGEIYLQIYAEANPQEEASLKNKWNDVTNNNYIEGEEEFFSLPHIGIICEIDNLEGQECVHNETEDVEEKMASCTEDGYSAHIICKQCGEVIGKEIIRASHSWKETTTVDAAPTCTEKGSQSIHCANCDMRKDVTELAALGHQVSSSYSHNSESHWKSCSRCDAKLEKAVHEGGAAGCITKAECSICGTVYGTANGHSWEETATVDAASTCTEEGSQSIHCADCDEVTDVQKLAALGHLTEEDYLSTSTKHWQVCTRCNAKVGEENHHGGDADCTVRAECEDCGIFYGSVGEHSWETVATVDTAPTCTEKGSQSIHCANCAVRKDVTELAALGHQVSSSYSHNSESHWKSCSRCDVTLEKEEHQCVELICEEEPICEVCGIKYGNILEHEWTDWVITKEATIVQEGEETRNCTVCQKEEVRMIEKLQTEKPDPIPIENPFKDVGTVDYFYEAVLWAVEKKITSGITADTFEPFKECSRAEIVTFLYRAIGENAKSDTECKFTDVDRSDWYYDAMMWAVDEGITTGMTLTTFQPFGTCTREQIVTFLWRAMGSEMVEGENLFTDVEENSWYYQAVLWALENNVTQGQTLTTFGVLKPCCRCDSVLFMRRALN